MPAKNRAFLLREPVLSFPSDLGLQLQFRVSQSELPVTHGKEKEIPGLTEESRDLTKCIGSDPGGQPPAFGGD